MFLPTEIFIYTVFFLEYWFKLYSPNYMKFLLFRLKTCLYIVWACNLFDLLDGLSYLKVIEHKKQKIEYCMHDVNCPFLEILLQK